MNNLWNSQKYLKPFDLCTVLNFLKRTKKMAGKHTCSYGEGDWRKHTSRAAARNAAGTTEYLSTKHINGSFWGKWKIRSSNVFCFHRQTMWPHSVNSAKLNEWTDESSFNPCSIVSVSCFKLRSCCTLFFVSSFLVNGLNDHRLFVSRLRGKKKNKKTPNIFYAKFSP